MNNRSKIPNGKVGCTFIDQLQRAEETTLFSVGSLSPSQSSNGKSRCGKGKALCYTRCDAHDKLSQELTTTAHCTHEQDMTKIK